MSASSSSSSSSAQGPQKAGDSPAPSSAAQSSQKEFDDKIEKIHGALNDILRTLNELKTDIQAEKIKGLNGALAQGRIRVNYMAILQEFHTIYDPNRVTEKLRSVSSMTYKIAALLKETDELLNINTQDEINTRILELQTLQLDFGTEKLKLQELQVSMWIAQEKSRGFQQETKVAQQKKLAAEALVVAAEAKLKNLEKQGIVTKNKKKAAAKAAVANAKKTLQTLQDEIAGADQKKSAVDKLNREIKVQGDELTKINGELKRAIATTKDLAEKADVAKKAIATTESATRAAKAELVKTQAEVVRLRHEMKATAGLAQSTAHQMLEQAKRDAEKIITEAKRTAAAEVSAARSTTQRELKAAEQARVAASEAKQLLKKLNAELQATRAPMAMVASAPSSRMANGATPILPTWPILSTCLIPLENGQFQPVLVSKILNYPPSVSGYYYAAPAQHYNTPPAAQIASAAASAAGLLHYTPSYVVTGNPSALFGGSSSSSSGHVGSHQSQQVALFSALNNKAK